MESPSGKRVQYILGGLIVLGSCLRIFVCLQHNPMDYLWSDPLRHWLNGVHFPKGAYTGASDPFLYQAYMSLVVMISFGNRLVVGLASGILSVVMPWTFYRAARDFGLGKRSALWVWVLIVWTPSLFTIYHYIMMETLLLLMEGAALWMTARYLRKGGSPAFLVSVIFWTLAALTKPTVIPLAAVCVVWSWWKKATPLRTVAFAAVVAVILILPQAIRSEVGLGFFAPFGNPWLTKIQQRSGTRLIDVHVHVPANQRLHFPEQSGDYRFVSPSCNIEPLWPFSHWQIRRASQDTATTVFVDTSHGDRDWKNAYDSLNVGWGEWLAQWRENIVLFFFSPPWPDVGKPEWDSWLTYVTRWMWAPLIAFLLIVNTRDFLRRRFALIPVAVTLFTLFLALQNVAMAEGRYRKPLEPLLLLNLVWVLASDDEKRSGREGVPVSSMGAKIPDTGLPAGPSPFSRLQGLVLNRVELALRPVSERFISVPKPASTGDTFLPFPVFMQPVKLCPFNTGINQA